jgi:hypothetical protein
VRHVVFNGPYRKNPQQTTARCGRIGRSAIAAVHRANDRVLRGSAAEHSPATCMGSVIRQLDGARVDRLSIQPLTSSQKGKKAATNRLHAAVAFLSMCASRTFGPCAGWRWCTILRWVLYRWRKHLSRRVTYMSRGLPTLPCDRRCIDDVSTMTILAITRGYR